MLVQARQARTAYAQAPRQARSTLAAGWIRWLYSPNLRLWVDACRDQNPTGTTVAATDDCSGRGVSITQPGAVAKRPAKSVNGNVPGFTFAGNASAQGLITPAIDLSATSQVTLAAIDNVTSGVACFLYEVSTSIDTSLVGCHLVRSGLAPNDYGAGLRGDFGYNYRYAASTLNAWYSHIGALNKANPLATEVLIYQDGVNNTGSGAFTNSTNTFGNVPTFVGSRNNGASFVVNGYISQLVLLDVAVTAAQATQLALLMRQRAGIA